jgi:hypothetical protein
VIGPAAGGGMTRRGDGEGTAVAVGGRRVVVGPKGAEAGQSRRRGGRGRSEEEEVTWRKTRECHSVAWRRTTGSHPPLSHYQFLSLTACHHYTTSVFDLYASSIIMHAKEHSGDKLGGWHWARTLLGWPQLVNIFLHHP